MDRRLRARVVVTEAQALGLSVNDLVAAAAGAPAGPSEVPTVSEYLPVLLQGLEPLPGRPETTG